MKRIVALILLFSFSAHAGPMILKRSHSGYGPIEWMSSETCALSVGRIDVTKTQGESEISYTLPFHFEENQLRDLMTQASLEKLEQEENGLCDGPSTVVTIAEGFVDTVLYSTGGCGVTKLVRKGPATKLLVSMISQFCQETF